MMEAVRTSETSVDNYFTRQYIPEDNSELHTRRRENLKSHLFKFCLLLNMSCNVHIINSCFDFPRTTSPTLLTLLLLLSSPPSSSSLSSLSSTRESCIKTRGITAVADISYCWIKCTSIYTGSPNTMVGWLVGVKGYWTLLRATCPPISSYLIWLFL
jgi:hypothetical protein